MRLKSKEFWWKLSLLGGWKLFPFYVKSGRSLNTPDRRGIRLAALLATRKMQASTFTFKLVHFPPPLAIKLFLNFRRLSELSVTTDVSITQCISRLIYGQTKGKWYWFKSLKCVLQSVIATVQQQRRWFSRITLINWAWHQSCLWSWLLIENAGRNRETRACTFA